MMNHDTSIIDRRHRKPKPNCPHCDQKFRDFMQLDLHLQYDCEALGR